VPQRLNTGLSQDRYSRVKEKTLRRVPVGQWREEPRPLAEQERPTRVLRHADASVSADRTEAPALVQPGRSYDALGVPA
jgi:hypothetical protein